MLDVGLLGTAGARSPATKTPAASERLVNRPSDATSERPISYVMVLLSQVASFQRLVVSTRARAACLVNRPGFC